MNKQAITFLTLFSLILVLSVYYIMLPPVDESVSSEGTTIEVLQQDLDKKREEIISKNNQLIAQESSTSDDISEALASNSEVKSLSEKEKSVVEKIKGLGYSDAFVEIEQNTVKITVVKKDSTNADASQIISETMNLMGDGFQVEVKFIAE